MVSVSNDGQNFTETRLYLAYDDVCYDCTVFDDVTDMGSKADDDILSQVFCTRKVGLCKCFMLLVNRRSEAT